MTSVTFNKDGKEDKMFIEANPQFKTLNLYDASMKKIYQENEKRETKQEPSKAPEKKETVKKGVNEGEDDSTAQKKRPKRRGVAV